MSLNSVPTLDELAASPERARDLSPENAAGLLAKLAGVQTVLLAKLLTANGTNPRVPPDDLLTIPETAKLLSVPTAYAYELARRREIPTIRLGKKYLRVSRSALAKWIAENRA